MANQFVEFQDADTLRVFTININAVETFSPVTGTEEITSIVLRSRHDRDIKVRASYEEVRKRFGAARD